MYTSPTKRMHTSHKTREVQHQEDPEPSHLMEEISIQPSSVDDVSEITSPQANLGLTNDDTATQSILRWVMKSLPGINFWTH